MRLDDSQPVLSSMTDFQLANIHLMHPNSPSPNPADVLNIPSPKTSDSDLIPPKASVLNSSIFHAVETVKLNSSSASPRVLRRPNKNMITSDCLKY